MTAYAQTSIWWPKVRRDIELTVQNCRLCAAKEEQRNEPLIPSDLSSQPWEKVGDLFKEENKWYLVVIDYYSKFIEGLHTVRWKCQK